MSQSVIKKISSHPNPREAIKQLLLRRDEVMLFPKDLVTLFKSFPEHSDLILLSSESDTQIVLENLAGYMPSRTLDHIFKERELEPTPELIRVLCERFERDPDLSAVLLIHLKQTKRANFSLLSPEVASSNHFLKKITQLLSGSLLKSALLEILQIVKKPLLKKSIEDLLSADMNENDLDLLDQKQIQSLPRSFIRVKAYIKQGEMETAKAELFDLLTSGEANIDFSLRPLKLSGPEINQIIQLLLKAQNVLAAIIVAEERPDDVGSKEHLLIVSHGIDKVDCLKRIRSSTSDAFVNALVSVCLSSRLDDQALSLANHPLLSHENAQRLARLILINKKPVLGSNALVEFIERNHALFSSDEIERLREKMDLKLVSRAVLKESADLFLRGQAIKEASRLAISAAQILNDLSIGLDETMITKLLVKGQREVKPGRLVSRIDRGEITFDNLNDDLKVKLRLYLAIHLINYGRVDKAKEHLEQLSHAESLRVLRGLNEKERIKPGNPVFSIFMEKKGFRNAFINELSSTFGEEVFNWLSSEELDLFVKEFGIRARVALSALKTKSFKDDLLEEIRFDDTRLTRSILEHLTDAQRARAILGYLRKETVGSELLEENLKTMYSMSKLAVIKGVIETRRFSLPSWLAKEILKEKYLTGLFKENLALFPSEFLVEICGQILLFHYDSKAAKQAILLLFEHDVETLESFSLSVLHKLLADNELSKREKDFLTSKLSPKQFEQLSLLYGPEIEKKRIIFSQGWPSARLSKTQSQILFHLKDTEEDKKIKALFIEAVRTSEIDLNQSPSFLDEVPEPLYLEVIAVLSGMMAKDEHISKDNLNALLKSPRQLKPTLFAKYVMDYNLDWTKLSAALMLQAIIYAVENDFESFRINKNGKLFELTYKSKVVGTLVDGEISLKPELEGLSADIKKLFKNLAHLPERIPSEVTGDYHFKQKRFIPNDKEFPLSEIKLEINVSDQALRTMNLISDRAILKGVKAFKVLTDSIVYILEIDQPHVLEVLSEKSELIEEARKLYESVKAVKKNSRKILDSLRLVSEDEERTFGLEIEMVSPIGRLGLAKKLGKNVIATDNYSSDMSWPKWTVKWDQSIVADSDDFKAELVSPILSGKSGLKEVQRVLLKLNQVAASSKVNFEVGEATRTGLHVHHSIQDLLESHGELVKGIKEIEKDSDVAVMMGNYLMGIQGALYALCSRWRLAATHSRPLRTPGELVNENGRHGFVISDYGTLEFRLKEATLNVEAIMRWIVITQQITISLIKRVNNELEAGKKALKTALDQGLEMILNEDLDQNHKDDVIQHLAYYQLAQKYAASAA